MDSDIRSPFPPNQNISFDVQYMPCPGILQKQHNLQPLKTKRDTFDVTTHSEPLGNARTLSLCLWRLDNVFSPLNTESTVIGKPNLVHHQKTFIRKYGTELELRLNIRVVAYVQAKLTPNY